MADQIDQAQALEQEHIALSLGRVGDAPRKTGTGVCEECELDSPALFGGLCAWCHDGRERPESAQPAPTFVIRQPVPAAAPEPAALEPEKRLTSPGKGMGRGSTPANVARRQDRRQLNVHFPSDRYEDIARIATATGSTPSAWAREVFMAALGDAAFEPGRKPFIPAEVIRAARDASQPLDVFVTSLIARGFAAHQQSTTEGAQ